MAWPWYAYIHIWTSHYHDSWYTCHHCFPALPSERRGSRCPWFPQTLTSPSSSDPNSEFFQSFPIPITTRFVVLNCCIKIWFLRRLIGDFVTSPAEIWLRYLRFRENFSVFLDWYGGRSDRVGGGSGVKWWVPVWR